MFIFMKFNFTISFLAYKDYKEYMLHLKVKEYLLTIMIQRIVIIGCGPTALGASLRLKELGILRQDVQVLILEKSDAPGGLSRSFRDKQGFLWDLGGHVVFSHYD